MDNIQFLQLADNICCAGANFDTADVDALAAKLVRDPAALLRMFPVSTWSPLVSQLLSNADVRVEEFRTCLFAVLLITWGRHRALDDVTVRILRALPSNVGLLSDAYQFRLLHQIELHAASFARCFIDHHMETHLRHWIAERRVGVLSSSSGGDDTATLIRNCLMSGCRALPYLVPQLIQLLPSFSQQQVASILSTVCPDYYVIDRNLRRSIVLNLLLTGINNLLLPKPFSLMAIVVDAS